MKFCLRYLVLGLWVTTLQTVSAAPGEQNTSRIFQYSTINALLLGYLDGELTYQQLATKGNFGLGTFNALNGEMVALDGQFYQIRVDGKAYPVTPQAKTPFATVTHFSPDQLVKLPENLSYEQLQKLLDRHIEKRGQFQAIRIDGSFKALKVRSVPKQKPPYRTLAEITQTEMATYEHKSVVGSLVGFRTPDYMNSLNVAGYHFHFIDQERKFGGHVLSLTTAEGDIAIDNIRDLELTLPNDRNFDRLNLGKDQSKDLKAVEQGHQ
ncbi:MAG: acetolactate decarboxylase [Endozoicomonas sp.]